MIRALVGIVAALALVGAAPPKQVSRHCLQIVYTAELQGNLLPCACPTASLGGLARRIGWIDSLRAAATGPVLVVDAGDALPQPRRFPLLSQEDFGALRRLHLEAIQRIGYDALVGSPEETKRESGTAWMAPNEARRIDRGGMGIVVAAVDERYDPQPAAAAIASLGPADVIILLCASDIHYAQRAARITGAYVAVVGRAACFHDAVWEDGVLFLGPGHEGKYAGRVRLGFSAQRKPELLDLSLRRMDATVPTATDWRRRVEDFVLSVERRYPGALASGE